MLPTRYRTAAVLTAAALTTSVLSACSGAGSGDSGDSKSINVLMVGNSQMVDIQKLTKANFTKDTGIKVNFTVLDENSLRAKVHDDVANKTGAFDVVTIGAYELPIWSQNGWLHEVSSYADKDSGFDYADVLDPMKTAATNPKGKKGFAPPPVLAAPPLLVVVA